MFTQSNDATLEGMPETFSQNRVTANANAAASAVCRKRGLEARIDCLFITVRHVLH